ncbi:MAG: asparagine synthase (glutamine-hydrolyzing) [Chloroflexota bacterium]|nr:asparagine synthase (glutamine-hydrolyzing) [Chloroflexota bacterium]
MCGISGIYNIDGQPPDMGLLRAMSSAIAHRGPDGERFFTEGGLGLAHRHLRIIDLSDAAMQPMTNESGTLQLIFNGEIYNYVELRPRLRALGHSFRSNSDTEVLLHAYEEWGVECLEQLNGMFAFALWDSERRRLFIARDRLGVKPLYYTWNGSHFAFASEIKSLLLDPATNRAPHLPSIAQYMNAMYTEGEQTWFKGVRRLLPGHMMLVQPEGMVVRRWWDLPAEEDAYGAKSRRYYIGKTRELLEDSVKLRMRSDVPLGAHLSGGLDSSAVVALLSRQLASFASSGATGERLRTFSGAFAEGTQYDERPYAHAMSKQYNTVYNETIPSADDLPRLLPQMLWHMDEPAAGPGILLQWAVCELTKSAGVTVINGGQGGDEAWGGYFGYIPAYLRSLARLARSHPGIVTELAADATLLALRPPLRSAAFKAIKQGRRGRLEADADLGEWAGPLFTSEASSQFASTPERAPQRQPTRTPLAAAMYHDLTNYLPALLQVEDRTSMAFSLESRAPLLDYRLVEHAATVPSALRMEHLQMKHILREAVRDLLPPLILKRTDKRGMPTPTALWFRTSLKGWVRGVLLSPEAVHAGILSPAYVRRVLDEHESGKVDHGSRIWQMLNVITWWQSVAEAFGQQNESSVHLAHVH